MVTKEAKRVVGAVAPLLLVLCLARASAQTDAPTPDAPADAPVDDDWVDPAADAAAPDASAPSTHAPSSPEASPPRESPTDPSTHSPRDRTERHGGPRRPVPTPAAGAESTRRDDTDDVDTDALVDDEGLRLDADWDEEDDDEAPSLRYYLEDVRVEGPTRTRHALILAYVPYDRGDIIDPASDDLEEIAWGIRGTGWFSRVRVRLERGSQRGWVDLVIEVEDQNSVVVNQFLVGISEGLSSTRDRDADVLPYVGFSFAETNLAGTGNSVSLAGLMSEKQQAARIGFQAPSFLASPYTLRLATSFHNGREFYGHQPFVSTRCPADAPVGCLEEVAASNAVVFYRRSSLSAGFGRTVGSSFHWAVDWVGDLLVATNVPEAASEIRGDTITPIDFAVEPGRSLVSSLRLSVGFDRRDSPTLTRRGLLVRAQADVGSRVFGSRYDYSRLQATIRGYVPLPRGQVLRFSGFAGIVTGDAPFFTLFHVSDLTDLIPSRVLEMDIDRRAAPNLLGTSISVMRAEEFAARADVQYEIAIQRGRPRQPLRGINAYLNVGLYTLSDLRELSLPPSGFPGASRIPVDLTYDVGVRIDTDIGLFEFGFSNLLGFIDLR